MSDETDKPSDQPPPEAAPPQPEPPSTMVGTVPTLPPPPPRDLSAGPATIVGTVPAMPYGDPYGYPPQDAAGPIPYHMPPPAGVDPFGGPQHQQPRLDYGMAPRKGEKWKQVASSAADFAKVHLVRAAARDLRSVNILPGEAPTLEAHGVHDQTVRQYLIWRRSWLYVVLPLAVIASIIQLWSFFSETIDLSTMSWFGVFVLGTMFLFQMVGYPIAAGLAVWKWDDLRFSRWVLLGGFFASYLLPFIVALIPFGNFIIIEDADPSMVAGQKWGAGIAGALIWLLTLLPALLAIMPGILRASVRIKSLLPESIVPGWLIVMTAPFFSLILLVVFAIINQVAGNLLLIIGMLLVMAAPAVFLMRTDLLIKPVTLPRERRKLETMQVSYVATIGLGMALLVLYFFTLSILGQPLVGDKTDAQNPAMISVGDFTWNMTSFVIGYLAKSLFVTAVAIDLFMLLNLSVWKNLKAFEGTEDAAKYDQIMGSFQTLVEDRGGNAGTGFDVVQR